MRQGRSSSRAIQGAITPGRRAAGTTTRVGLVRVNQVFELLVSGLSLGCIYALIAMGFVIVFKATNVVNFAHASVLMLGAYLVAKWHDSLGFLGALLAAAAACAVVAALLASCSCDRCAGAAAGSTRSRSSPSA